MKENPKCKDCQDTGEIEVRSVHLGRSYFDKKLGKLVTPYLPYGEFYLAECPCIGEYVHDD